MVPGVKLTLMLQLCRWLPSSATVGLRIVDDTATLVKVSAAPVLFVSLMAFAAVLVPTVTLPKFPLVGANATVVVLPVPVTWRSEDCSRHCR